ncbi:MAG TPA: DegQ family serine endoprotease [Acetobacteraceae bacterium]|nr:DegQ family serine endoprotease [Acetobacteraceae bacterium]
MRAVLCRSIRVAGVLVMLFAAPAFARGVPSSFADLAAKLLPSVVNISSTETLAAGAHMPNMPGVAPGSPFEKFLHQFLKDHGQGNKGGGNGGNNNGNRGPEKLQKLGSGFIIGASGIIVTNNHVIDHANTIKVTLHDGSTFTAKLLGHDDTTDLAVLKISAGHPLPFVSFGDSAKARIGDWVLAIGNPYGLGGSVSAGIVSARGRNIQQGPYDDFIQTDAAINRGNSGGPLFNMDGQVIGINTAIYSPSGGSIGIGFAIPADLAKVVVAQLRQYGKARRGWLGVRIQSVTPDIAAALGLPHAEGALVAGVIDGGPAAGAKIASGDVILRFNNAPVQDMHSLPRMVAETAIGSTVPVEVWHKGKSVTLQIKLTQMPAEPTLAALATPPKPKPAPAPSLPEIAGLGLHLAPLSPALRDKYQVRADLNGVVVTAVKPGSPAAKNGVTAGDVIVEVQQFDVRTPQDVQARIKAVRQQKRPSVLMLVEGGAGTRWVPLPLKQPG